MAYMAFSGSFEHSLDGKGRVIIPASFREALGENFTITINPTRTAVAIYPKADWDGQLERLSHINPMDKIGLQYERYLMSVSFSGNSMDAQGRDAGYDLEIPGYAANVFSVRYGYDGDGQPTLDQQTDRAADAYGTTQRDHDQRSRVNGAQHGNRHCGEGIQSQHGKCC